MAFQVVYVADGDINTVRKIKGVDNVSKVEYLENIKNFAQLSQPYNKMKMINIPAMQGIFELEYISPNEETELISIVVTCSGYGENDYYNLYVNDELWFDTWFPTEVKEGLFAGTSTYVYVLKPESKFTLKFMNISGTSKKVWMGIRMLREHRTEEDTTVEIVDTDTVAEPVGEITNTEMEVIPDF